MRTAIGDKVIELIQKHFFWLNDDEDTPAGISNQIQNECETFDELGLSMAEVRDFVDEVLILAFGLEDIPTADIMSWRRVKDIIDYIENYTKAAANDIPKGGGQ